MTLHAQPGHETHPPPRFGVLFVDDEQTARESFDEYYSERYRVLTSSNADEAEALLEADPSIAVVVTDHRMDDRDGIDLLAAVKERHPEVVRLLTTAYPDVNLSMSVTNEVEVYRYITKPWDFERLSRALEEAMQRYLAERARRLEEEMQREKRRTMLSLAASVAHELRTPLLSIRAAAQGMGKYLPTLLKSYDNCRARDEVDVVIRPAHREALDSVVEDIEDEVKQANSAINLLLANVRDEAYDSAEFTPLSMRGALNDAIERYPFQEGQREQIAEIEGDDFIFNGSAPLFTYVLFNLLKNALHAIAAVRKGGITIRLEAGGREHKLIFRDSGSGIPERVMPHIFEDFFTTGAPGEGNGIGLPFCRRVIRGMQGRIDCRSREGEYTEFTITLPATGGND